jgi:hypothetical protein
VWHQTSLKSDSATDFIDDHVYFDHPKPGKLERYSPGDPRGPWFVEKVYKNKPLCATDPALNKRLLNQLSFGALSGKPMIATEWDVLTPNEYRTDACFAMGAYMLFQGYNASFHFSYGFSAGYKSWNKLIDNKLYRATGFSSPATMFIMPFCAMMFKRGDVSLAKNRVEIGYSYTDTYYGRDWRIPSGAPEYFLPYITGCRHKFFDKNYTPSPKASISYSSGYSSQGNYSSARRRVIATKNPWSDLYNKNFGRWRLFLSEFPKVKTDEVSNVVLDFKKLCGRKIFCSSKLDLLEIKSLPKGAEVFGVDGSGKYCLGFLHNKSFIAPSLYDMATENNDVSALLFTKAAKIWGELPPEAGYFQDGFIVTDTKQIKNDFKNGIIIVDTPRTQFIGGFLGGKGKIKSSSLEVEAENKYCCIALSSYDALSLHESSKLLLGVMSRAKNTDSSVQIFEMKIECNEVIPGFGKNENGIKKRIEKVYVQTDPGKAPVVIEPLKVTIRIRNASGKSPVITPINHDGEKMPKLPVFSKDGWHKFSINKTPFLFYEINFE